ncbi:HD domain-containing protein [Streptomyces iranensis]|uniref:(P)ppGpp synthase/HD superfamily hydrolase n=1 Tax=Streptomyces iranensis TaxID=576784 RepID=A0A060ZVV7_9ACTN|nr:HD domain-containing protein [Streptomyces iranensis]MBP2059627.1 (p)ppGpp synthase/HD superfamily hydrolase [Streptomyces iranensis]CDR10363.1 ppGpp synthetase [Streptomyces iranensis]
MSNTPAVTDELGLMDWPEPARERGRHAIALATAIYTGHVRDQGTPYINHPVRVVAILKNELGVTEPDLLILGLLHDALEISPSAEPMIESGLGGAFAQRLRSMIPDHRLEQRPKQPGDADTWHDKIQALGQDELLVRLADRIDNLRDLRHSPDSGRRARFLGSLTRTYLPLAEESREVSAPLRAAFVLLSAEYQRHAQETAAQ